MSPNRPMLDCPCRRPTANSKRTNIRPVRCILPRRRKWWRAGHAHLHCRTTRAPASSNQRVPSHAFSPRAQAAPPPVVGLIHNRGPAAAASINIVVIVTIAIARSQNPTGRSLPRTCTVGPRVHTAPPPAPGLKRSSGPILWSKTTEGSRTRVLSRRHRHRRVGQACRGRRSRAATHLSWLVLSHPCSCPPAQTRPTFSTTSVVTDIAVPVMEGAAVPLRTASQSTARMTMLPSHRANAAGYALHPPSPAEQRPSRRPAYIAQARLKGEQPSAQSLAEASVLQLFQKTRDSSVKVALSRRYKHRRYSPPPARSASSIRATSTVIDIAVPMMGRTTVLVCAATPNTARMRLSGHRDASAIGRALQHIQPEEQPLSSRDIRTAATLHREKLGDHPGGRGASAALPIRHRHERPPLKGTPRRTAPPPQRSRNGPLEMRSSSALQ